MIRKGRHTLVPVDFRNISRLVVFRWTVPPLFPPDSEEPKILHSNRKIEDYDSSDHEIIVGDTLRTLVGAMVTVTCRAEGNPPPEVKWTKGGLPIDTSRRTKSVYNGTLVIHEGTWSDAGEYRCVATNAVGTEEKITFLQFEGK